MMHIRFRKIKLFFRFFSLSCNHCRWEGSEIMRILSNLKNGLGFACLLALPIGIYQGDPDSTNASLGVYGGTGQYAAIIEGCETQPAQTRNSFSDVAGAAYVRIPVTRNWNESPIILGLRVGTFGSTFTPAHFAGDPPGGTYVGPASTHFTYSYINPNLSLEFTGIGFGMGYLSKPVPVYFSNGIDWSKQFTAHFRLGTPEKFYVYYEVNESMPLASGGGNVVTGVGFPVGNISMFHGVSWGHYNHPGLVHRLRFPVNRTAAIDASLRWGTARGIFEGGIALGFVYSFGRPYTKPVTKPADW